MDAMKGVDFSATGENGDYTYYVQPCNRQLSSQFAACNNVDQNLIGCQLHKSTTLAFGLGVMDKFDVTKVQDDFVVTNSFPSIIDYKIRQLHLTIKCATQDATFSYDGNSGIDSPIIYRFTLLTKYICGGGGGQFSIDVEVGLSAGSIMVIIFFVLITVYFVGGLIFNKFVKKAEGTEIIPNRAFWITIPLLAKDGVMFIFRGCKGSATYAKT